jgi:hypothetical protein
VLFAWQSIQLLTVASRLMLICWNYRLPANDWNRAPFDKLMALRKLEGQRLNVLNDLNIK